jgi:excisionase family DNA binding protein
MEKFCIIKRRKQSFQDPFPSILPIQLEESDFLESPARKDSDVSFSLTPWQSEAIRSGGILPLLEDEIPKNMNLTLCKEENGSVIFNFHLDLDYNLMMLKPHQVCQMMQISRASLNRMVHENKIKSYKIGRLRRFSHKDVLETLNQSLT